MSEIKKVILEFDCGMCMGRRQKEYTEFTVNVLTEFEDKKILDKLKAILTNCHGRVENGKSFFPRVGSDDAQQAKDFEYLKSLRGKDLGEDETLVYKQIVSKSPSFSEP